MCRNNRILALAVVGLSTCGPAGGVPFVQQHRQGHSQDRLGGDELVFEPNSWIVLQPVAVICVDAPIVDLDQTFMIQGY